MTTIMKKAGVRTSPLGSMAFQLSLPGFVSNLCGDQLFTSVNYVYESVSPSEFEFLVRDYLAEVKRIGNLKVTAQSHDEGIDGLGEIFDGIPIAFQAKKHAAKIGRPRLLEFRGALDLANIQVGYFISWAGFTRDAIKYCTRVRGLTINLVDGRELCEWLACVRLGLMEDSHVEKQ